MCPQRLVLSLATVLPVVGCSTGVPPLFGTGSPMQGPGMTASACSTDADCENEAATPHCLATLKRCVPHGFAIGIRDGSRSSVSLTVVYEPDRPRHPTGLAFNPARPNELWVVNEMDDTMLILTDPGTSDMSAQHLKDPDALHFNHKPTGIAFCGTEACAAPGSPGYFGTCGENDGSQDFEMGFTGPVLWDSDPAIFAEATPNGLGSHIDMLHDTMFCMGIAHERDNAYWVFDGDKGSLARYDFHEPHQPGGDDHSDGEIAQYAIGELARAPGIPSHLVYDGASKLVYAADTGNKRVVSLDISTATDVGPLPTMEPTVPEQWDGATLKEVVPQGMLEAPSGLALSDQLLFVTDNATGLIHAFDRTGALVRSLDTGLPSGSLAGITIGPDRKAYFVDMLTSRIYRIDPM